MAVDRTGSNVIGYFDSNERGHDPTPCSSSVNVLGVARPFPESGQARLRVAPLRAMRGRDTGRREWPHRHNTDRRRILAARAPPRSDTARNGLVQFPQSCATERTLRHHRVHISVSALQAYCSLGNQTIRANLYVDAKTCPIAVKIGNYLEIRSIFATIELLRLAPLKGAWVSARRQRVPEPFGKIVGICCARASPRPSLSKATR